MFPPLVLYLNYLFLPDRNLALDLDLDLDIALDLHPRQPRRGPLVAFSARPQPLWLFALPVRQGEGSAVSLPVVSPLPLPPLR